MTHKKTLVAAIGRAVALAVLLAAGVSLAGDDVPLKATVVTTSFTVTPGTFPVLATVISYGKGTSTHLGNLTTTGEITLTWTPSGVWSEGTAITIAANGDELYTSQSGWTTGPGELDGTFTITGGTGRFDGATGSGTVTAAVDEDGVQVAYYTGTINYKKN